jgi:hypothetical protein
MSVLIESKTAKFLIAGFILLLINSSYLAAYAEPTLFYFSNVALHLLMGLVLAVTSAIYLRKRLRGLSRSMLFAVIALTLSAGRLSHDIRRDAPLPLGALRAHSAGRRGVYPNCRVAV